MQKTILIVGATGHLGGKVIQQLLDENVTIRALVRPGTDATNLKDHGIQVFRGDINNKPTLVESLTGIDALITTAIGYAKRRKGDSLKTDDLGNKNLAELALQLNVHRFVFTSILNCEMAPNVPHFWQKKLTEDYFDQIGLKYVSIRPGAFIDQNPRNDFYMNGLKSGHLKVMGTKTIKWTQTLSDDVARYLVRAALDENIPFEKINIGAKEPMNMEMFAQYASEYIGKPIKVSVLPWPIVGTMLSIQGIFNPLMGDIKKMFDFFFTGKYVANITRQQQIFGNVPDNKESVYKYCQQIGLNRVKR